MFYDKFCHLEKLEGGGIYKDWKPTSSHCQFCDLGGFKFETIKAETTSDTKGEVS